MRVGARRRRSKGKPKHKLYILLLIFLCMFVGGSVLGVVEYPTYHSMYQKDTALAQTGAAHLERAQALLVSLQKDPLNAQVVNQAQQEFAAALPVFSQLNNDLKSLPGISSFIPVLSDAFHLAPAAMELSQAGIVGCDILKLLIARYHNPLNVRQGQGLTMVDVATIGQLFQQIKTALSLAIAQVKQVNATDVLLFNPRLGKMFATFQMEIPAIQSGLDDVDRLLPVLPALLGIGTPTNYLLEVLDSTELRPGGGFLGNYGIVTLSAARLMAARIIDVDLLDIPFTNAGNVIPYPPAYRWFWLTPSWSLRDSNLDADFPTDARNAEQIYRQEGGTVPAEGVIAITPALIQHTLEITGPIDVTEYHEVITAQNLIARIQYHELAPAGYEGLPTVPARDGYSSLRKHFTAVLAKHVLARVRQLSASALVRFSQLIIDSLRSKDIQLYFDSSAAENILQLSHLDDAIRPADKDSLFVVDANLGATKANNFIVDTLSDQVTLDAEGTAVHQTTLSYAWTIARQSYGYPTYRDYQRIYAPPGSTLDMLTGLAPMQSSQAFGHRVWAGSFTLLYGQTHVITLVWRVPHAATQDSSGWHYQYLLQRQAGAQWKVNLRVTLPSCVVMSNTWGGLASSSKQAATLTQSLNEDLNLGIDYNC